MLPDLTLTVAYIYSLLALVPHVAAHGWVKEVILGDTKYTGYLPYVDPYTNPTPQRIIRKVPWNGPVQDVSLIDLQCNGYTAGGIPTAPAPLFGTVAAGDTVHFMWSSWPDNHKGPVLTYMARVPDGQDVRSWTPSRDDKVWFKIHHAGQLDGGRWATEELGYASESSVVRIPPNLKAGQYLIRHEIMALHFGFAYPGIQIYPSCVQVEVTEGGDAFPSDSDMVSFPGAYTPDTPGMVYDLYDTKAAAYEIPGPEVWTGGDN